jgi:hypothetical protein
MPRIDSSGSGAAGALAIWYDPAFQSPALLLMAVAAASLFFHIARLTFAIDEFFFTLRLT